MSADDRRIDELVEAVAEGRSIDWPGVIDGCAGEDARCLIEQLRILADIAHTAPPPVPPKVMFRWGPLEVLEELGRGAFGRVYRARDPRLDREVALKLFDHSALGNGQLIREAQLLARIRHPHVVLVHGADATGGQAGLWMELIRGRTLNDVVREQGPFGPREATLIGLDLCRALAAVHGARLVHRDIKTSNVMRETGGRIVLMDFGAGIHLDTDRALAPSDTGTPFYMAPELLEGGEASIATDLYALGVLLFHLITGDYPVAGSSITELRERHRNQTRVLLREARPDVPSALGQVVDRALCPSAADRFRGTADMERALASTLDVERTVALDALPSRRRWTRSPFVAAAVILAISIVAGSLFVVSHAGFAFEPDARSSEPVAFSVEPPVNAGFAIGAGLLAISPDGSRIAFASSTKQTSTSLPDRLWLRRLRSLLPEPIANTETGYQPFWSPDGRFVGFTARNMVIKRVDVTGGSAITLADWGLGGTWSSEGVILFSGHDGRLYRVSQDGGQVTTATTLDAARGETRHLWPSFLPDGRRFLFTAESAPGESVIYVGTLDSQIRTSVANVASKAEYADSYLYYQRQGTLVAQPFDLASTQLTGEATTLAESVRFSGEGRAAFSVSRNGVVVYATESGAAALNSLTWFDVAGKRLASASEPGTYAYPSLSPDGSRVAVNRLTPERLWDIWMVDLVRNVTTRFTFSNQVTFSPIVWSPDGRHLMYAAQDDSRKVFHLYRRSVSGASMDELLYASADDKTATGISLDGRILLFNRELGKGHGTDTWALPLSGASRAPFPLFTSPYDEESAVFSPNGHWIAYASNESGVFQIYAQPFPATGTKVQISSDGGMWPRWSTDGRVFFSTEDRVWSVEVRESAGTLHASVPRAMVNQRFSGNRWGGFAIDPAGKRVLLVVPQDAETSSLKVLVNPLADLKSRR